MKLTQFLHSSYTSYHAVANAAAMLEKAGFVPLGHAAQQSAAGVYRAEGGTLFACKRGANVLQLALAHTDSPALRVTSNAGAPLLSVEKYGGGLLRAYLDRPLKIAGRAVVRENGVLVCKNVCSAFTVTVPSLAVHLGGGQAGEELTVLRDMRPLIGACENVAAALGVPDAVQTDLFCVPDDTPYLSGINGQYLCAPRIDNLASVYACVRALADARPRATCAIACFDHEEVGSETREGAQSGRLRAFLTEALGKDAQEMLENAFALSCDGAHAFHPAHAEKYGAAYPVLGGGVAVKRNDRYATDALTAAVVTEIFGRAALPVQTYRHHPDKRCGSTIGLTAAHTLSCRVCDIGVPQLAMHAAVETAAVGDLQDLQKGLTAFFQSTVTFAGESVRIDG